MIIVDTNVVSEPLRPKAEPRVGAWLDRQHAQTLFLSTVTVAEILFGIHALPKGRRREGLLQSFSSGIEGMFEGRILAFDLAAARLYGPMLAKARAEGVALSVADAQIAAIAKAHGFSVATRDERPFRSVGLATINPWTE